MNKPLILLLTVPLALLILQGCAATTVDFSKPGEGSPPLYDLKPLPVKLSDELKNLEEYLILGLKEDPVKLTLFVGKAFQRLFTGNEGSAVQLELINSRITGSMSDVAFLFTTFNRDYTISVALNILGTTHTVYAHGTGNSGVGPLPAAQYAVENAVYDLYKQIEVLLSAGP